MRPEDPLLDESLVPTLPETLRRSRPSSGCPADRPCCGSRAWAPGEQPFCGHHPSCEATAEFRRELQSLWTFRQRVAEMQVLDAENRCIFCRVRFGRRGVDWHRLDCLWLLAQPDNGGDDILCLLEE